MENKLVNANNGCKYKILTLSDHPLAPSGVGIQSRYLFESLLNTGKYSIRSFGGAIKHGNYDVAHVQPYGSDWIIVPTDGFGDPMKLRVAMATEKPDAILLFTDPRFFVWVFEMEDEIHDICPIIYNHIWDEEPFPAFNRPIYEATDTLNCISWKTYSLVHPNYPEKTNYIPHALHKSVFKPLQNSEVYAYKKQILGEDNVDTFTAIWVNRNARRKRPGDVLDSWRIFCNQLEKECGHRKAIIIMHTDPLDQEGPNLYKQIEMLGLEQNVYISKEKLDFDKMNILYNISDICVNISNAEGFGLSTLEALYCAKPIVVTKTGGLTRQVENPETGEQYGVGLEPDVRTLVGSQLVPYIYEDLIHNSNTANAIYKMYILGADGRKELGMRGQRYAHNAFSMEHLTKRWDETLEETILKYKENRNKPRYVIKTI